MIEQTYLDLFAKLDAAREPSRELDCLIFEAQHLLLMPAHRGTIDGEPTGQYFDQDGNELPERAPFYTASVDDAMKLLRKHYLWQIKQGIECTAIVWWLEKDWDDTGAPAAYSTTYPALALAKAALLACAVEDRISIPPRALSTVVSSQDRGAQ